MRGFHLFFCCLSMSGAGQSVFAEDSLFAKPGRMIEVEKGSRLSLYCIGSGRPTILLESGFGGGAAATWSKLQPVLGAITRTCSYDRAGYGFSILGSNVPRDLHRAVADLTQLLQRSGERAPFLLAGHSNGGLIISAFADRFPRRVAGLVFLDAAVVLPEDKLLPAEPKQPLDAQSRSHLDRIQRCLERAIKGSLPGASGGDECVDRSWFVGMSPDLAAAEIANQSKPDYWRAYLSEAEQNYSSTLSRQARERLPHRWLDLPVWVYTASASAMSDEAAAKAFGLDPRNNAALAEARQNRARGERRQQAVCKLSRACKAVLVPTADHLVHNEVTSGIADSIRQFVEAFRSSGPGSRPRARLGR
jgi:pimeloyl-ACP methyl ester carboxylesterase